MIRQIFTVVLAMVIFTMCTQPDTNYVPDKTERKWIEQNEITIGIYPFYPPYAYLEEKKTIVGIFPDLFNIIVNASGLQYKQVVYPTWGKFLDAAQKGEIDVINLIIPTPERRKYLFFTEPIVMDPHVMVVRKDDDAPETLTELKKRKDLVIAAIEGYFISDYVEKNFPEHTIKYFVDDRECIIALDERQVDVFMTQKYTSEYFINKMSGLKTISDIPANTVLSIGINKNKPMLKRIVSKAVNGISDDDMAKLINQWTYKKYLPVYKKAEFWIGAGLLAALFALLLLVWNKTLSRKVKNKTSELLQAKQKAEESDRLKTAFVSNISHEIRTPLNAINGYSELMSLELSNERVRQYTNDIIANSHRLTNVIENIIIFSQLERGQLGIYNQQTNLNNLISNVLTKCREMHPDKIQHLKITSSCPENSTEIETDPYYLRKMLGYILDNAIKFTEEGSVTIGYTQEKQSLKIFIKDTGPGIDPDTLPKIFDKFHKFSVFKDRLSSGTGVGLTIAKGLSDQLGLKMDVESTPGEGTSFYFTANKETGTKKAT